MAVAPLRLSHRRKRERKPREGTMLHQNGSRPSGWPARGWPCDASSTDTLSFWT